MNEILLAIMGGGLVAAILKFVEFLIKHRSDRKDHKEDIDDKINETKKANEDFLTKANAEWKIKYCDKNYTSIQELANITSELKNNAILLTNNIVQMQEYNCHIGDAVKGIIHDRIIHNVDTYIERGGLTREEHTTLISLYEPYKNLGGNGDVKIAYNIAMKLPILTKEEAIEMDKKLKKENLFK